MRLDHVVPFMTKFSQAKIFAKGSYFVLGQKSRQSSELPSRKLWVELVSCYAHAYAPVLTIARICQNFHSTKKFAEKNWPTAYIGEFGKNFLLAKISA